MEVKRLKCLYNGKVVGHLVENKSGKIMFQYDETWLKDGFSISPISLPLKKGIYICSKDLLNGLYGVFFDSLPDGWGELVTRRALAKNGINYDKLSPLTKLSLVGTDGLGGLVYVPTKYQATENVNFDLDYLAVEMKKVLDSKETESLDQIYYYGGSSGGARPKAHIRVYDEEWIVKFPTHREPDNMGELEYKANMIAKECGIKVVEYDLFKSNICSGYYGSKRFDRIGSKRIHTISLSSLLETSHRIPNLDYIHLFKVIHKICRNQEDLYEAYRRMCFNVFYQNKDDHGKNFSFIYDESIKSYTLSPAYDITKLPNKFEHEMTVNSNGNPTEDDLLAVCDIMNLQKDICKKIISHIKDVIRKYK